MAEKAYIGINDVAHKVSKGHLGINGISRKVKKMYVGDSNGIAQMVFCSTIYLNNVPKQSGTLTYTGKSLTPTWSNYDTVALTIGGVTSATNAGSYKATFTPNEGYCWSDGSVAAKTVSWSISKASCGLAASQTSVSLNDNTTTFAITVTRSGTGTISVASSDTSIATVSISGSTVTVNAVDYTSGSTKITITVAETANYLTGKLVVAVTASFMPRPKLYGTAPPLSIARANSAAASGGAYALFAGGYMRDAGAYIVGQWVKNVDAYSTELIRTSAQQLSIALEWPSMVVANGRFMLTGHLYSSEYNARNSFMYSYDSDLILSEHERPPVSRTGITAGVAGTYTLAAGGYNGSAYVTNVDAYDSALTRTNAPALSVARDEIISTSIAGYALFAGGVTSSATSTYSAAVDAYDSGLTRVSASALSTTVRRGAGATVDRYALIAGGYKSASDTTDIVNAYDEYLTRTNPTPLSAGRRGHAGTTLGGYAIFAGGASSVSYKSNLCNTVDCYNASLTRSATDDLTNPAGYLAAASIGPYALFAGGGNDSGNYPVADVYAYELK